MNMLRLAMCLAPLGAVACATSGPPAPIIYSGRAPAASPPSVIAAPPASPLSNTYATAPHASPAGLLRACPSGGSNLGPMDLNGVSMLYTPYIEVDGLTLIRNPTEASCLSSGFGDRALASGGGRSHTGLDLANAAGGYIFAAADGRVISAGPRGDYGLAIELDHGAGVRTMYGHLSEINPALPIGASVVAGAAIGRMGMTGNATGVHLHYEVVVDGVKVDPLAVGIPAPPAPSSVLEVAGTQPVS